MQCPWAAGVPSIGRWPDVRVGSDSVYSVADWKGGVNHGDSTISLLWGIKNLVTWITYHI